MNTSNKLLICKPPQKIAQMKKIKLKTTSLKNLLKLLKTADKKPETAMITPKTAKFLANRARPIMEQTPTTATDPIPIKTRASKIKNNENNLPKLTPKKLKLHNEIKTAIAMKKKPTKS